MNDFIGGFTRKKTEVYALIKYVGKATFHLSTICYKTNVYV